MPELSSKDRVVGKRVRAGLPPIAWVVILALMGVVAMWFWLSEPVSSPISRGEAAPGFRLPQLDGGEVSLSSLSGQVVLVNFWATWCKPCEEEMPAMERLYQILRNSGFELLAVSVDTESDAVEEFRNRLGVTFPILRDPDQRISRRYQTTGFPESVLVDQDGVIVERYIGPRDWDHPDYVNRLRRLIER